MPGGRGRSKYAVNKAVIRPKVSIFTLIYESRVQSLLVRVVFHPLCSLALYMHVCLGLSNWLYDLCCCCLFIIIILLLSKTCAPKYGWMRCCQAGPVLTSFYIVPRIT
jgi:hypothetical protein